MQNRAIFFVTGTDTEIGKTTIAAALLHGANKLGLSTMGLKPIASGSEQTSEGLRNADALALWQECSIPLSYEEVNPFYFEPAIAPHIAAASIGKVLKANQLVDIIQHRLTKQADFTLIEGAGGWYTPLNERELFSDVVKALSIPVILVVGMRLGCVNHALLTKQAILKEGLSVVGWVANVVDSKMANLSENIQTLSDHLDIPLLGIVPNLPTPTPADISTYLDLSSLIEVNTHD